jgi:hypothetical protein
LKTDQFLKSSQTGFTINHKNRVIFNGFVIHASIESMSEDYIKKSQKNVFKLEINIRKVKFVPTIVLKGCVAKQW